MNWLVFAVVGFLLLAAWDGHRKGFIKKSVGIVSLVLTLFLTSAASSHIMTFLKEKTALHRVLQRTVVSAEADILEAFKLIGLEDIIGDYVADMILGFIAFLPVLHGLNKTAGLLLGLVEGILFVWIFFFGVTVCAGTKTGMELLWMIADSSLLSWIYRKNLLLLLL